MSVDLTQPAPFGKSDELKERLRALLEAHLSSRLVEATDGGLKMLVLHAKSKNEKIKDKFLNFFLGEVSQRLLEGGTLRLREAVVCEYLIGEAEKFVATKLNKN